MWVEQTKQGKYKYTERYKDALTGKYKRASIVLDKNTRQAQKQAQAALQERIKAEQEPKIKNINLSELLELYEAEKKVTIKASSYLSDISRIRKTINIIGEDILIENLTAGIIRSKLISNGESISTINGRIDKIKGLLRWAYKNDYLKDPSCIDKLDKLKDSSPQAKKLEDKFLESQDAIRLVQHIRNRQWREFTEFLLLSGLRYGEAAALIRSDLDFAERVIHVTKNYDSRNKIVTTAKTPKSQRDVFMQLELYALCKKLIAESTASTVISINKDRLLFSNKGDKLEYEAYCAYLKRASKKILGREITPHVLRHPYVKPTTKKFITFFEAFRAAI